MILPPDPADEAHAERTRAAERASLRRRAADAIPGGSSTGSKQPAALYGIAADDAALPTHFERAEGCAFITSDGRRYIDCGMALGAVAIGYADPAVTRAVQDAAAAGNVAALPHRLEIEVAERLVEMIPCAEQVRFLRTGAEAVAAAVRLARAATGRQQVIGSGYFGWLDWCSDAEGVDEGTRATFTTVPFGDVAALEMAVQRAGTTLAAIVLEPLVHEVAPRAWLDAARAACDRVGAVLVFDEIKTAFRMRTGGVQELLGVVPDLTTVGKALANGYPLAAVVGRAAIMEAAMRTWISSTAAAESTGLAAARAVMDWHDRVDVPERLLVAGLALQGALDEALDAARWIGVRTAGPPQMFRLVADRDEQLDRFVAATVRHGVLLKRGAYQFASLAHDERSVDIVARAAHQACAEFPQGPRRV